MNAWQTNPKGRLRGGYLDEHFARHFESLWRETWRHTGGRTVQEISLETPSPADVLYIYIYKRWNDEIQIDHQLKSAQWVYQSLNVTIEDELNIDGGKHVLAIFLS